MTLSDVQLAAWACPLIARIAEVERLRTALRATDMERSQHTQLVERIGGVRFEPITPADDEDVTGNDVVTFAAMLSTTTSPPASGTP